MSDSQKVKPVRSELTSEEAYNRFFTPVRRSPTAAEKIVIDQAEVSCLSSNLVDVFLYSWGAGPTVLLVHGWGGCASQLSAFVSPLVDSGYRVLACDLPAHGQTAGEQTNAFEFAETLLAIAAEENKFQGIIAHSWGSAATIVAMTEREIAQRVVCLGTPCWLSSSVSTISKMLKLSTETDAAMRQLFEHRLGQNVWQRASMDLRATELSVPGLLFHDIKDRKVDYKESEAIAATWKNAELVLTSGLGHTRILRNPEVVQRAIAFAIQDVLR